MIVELIAQAGTEVAAVGALRKRRRLRRFVHGTALALLALVFVLAW